ncbi:Serine/threonine-protein kinase [Ceratobasidium sp. AG-Ba]|nr:Serine/threonine-protein kinase [Ceratobasidium sp. AG-Ba]
MATVQRSGSREFASRDFRGVSRPQTRWLVVLMPPPHLTNELAVGHRSPGRIANGLLVPLFPTLFAQLTAIAKEFSLPSTTGLCLYLHLPDAPATPRVTDDIWPLLWSRHLHAEESTLPLGIPIAGRIEFDIDVPNARWYPMWFAHVSRQELVPDLARTIPASPRAIGRELLSPRAQPKSVPRPLALVPRDEPAVQVETAPSPAPSPSRQAIPKSASKETVEKVRRWSALVTPDPALHSDVPPIEPIVATEITAPPTEVTAIPLSTEQAPEVEDEPLNLEDFQWSITSAGPPSPTSSCATSASSRVISIHMLERNEGSVCLTPTTATTWGPPSVSDVESDFNLNLGWRVRSPDIGERAEGSVLLTPSTATSWGAPLSYPPTPAQWIAMQELVRSPDLGERAEGSVLLTPSTATTWGAPLTYPPTPAEWYAMQQYVRSPDAGQRAEGSVLLTPSTATTWGAPETFPATPEAWREHIEGAIPSPDLGARAEVEGEFGRSRHSAMVWSNQTETEEESYRRMGLPYVWEFGWPARAQATLEPVEEEAVDRVVSEAEFEELAPVVLVTRENEPEFDRQSFEAGWPQFEQELGDISLQIEENSALEEGYSAEFGIMGSEQGVDAFEYDAPRFEALPTDEERDDDDDTEADAFEFELPHFELVEGEGDQEREDDDAGPDTVTPDVFEYSLPEYELQPSPVHAEHPALVESPMSIVTTESVAAAVSSIVTETSTSATVVQTRSYGAYPFLVLYPAVYPHLDLYPIAPASTLSVTRSISTLQTLSITQLASSSSPIQSVPGVPSSVDSIRSPPSSRKPSLSVQVPRSRSSSIVAVNPADGRSRAWSRALPPVPPVPREIVEQSRSLERKRSGSTEHVRTGSSGTVLKRLVEKKPSVVFDNTQFELSPSEKKSTLSSAYPHRYPYNLAVLYPLSYPHNLDVLYPSVVKVPAASAPAPSVDPVSGLQTKVASALKRSDVLQASHPIVQRAKASGYPTFNLYPAVYPYNLLEIYPAAAARAPVSSETASAEVIVKRQTKLAALPRPSKSLQLGSIEVRLSARYPAFDLFPEVYPYNLERIYPAVVGTRLAAPSPPKTDVAQAQILVPTLAQSSPKTLVGMTVRLDRVYPNIELYAPVYPFSLDIYPSKLAHAPAALRMAETSVGTGIVNHVINPTRRARKTHAQLCLEAFRKTHAQLVSEVSRAAVVARTRKTHQQLQVEVFPNGLPEAEPLDVSLASTEVTVTPALGIPTEASPAPQPATRPLRRQRSGTVMMRGAPTGESTPPLPPIPSSQTADLSRSRSMIESRTQMFERSAAPPRSQTIGPARPLRGKSAQFERAMSLFHDSEETSNAASEGSRTPPRISKNVSKLDMSKFKFS